VYLLADPGFPPPLNFYEASRFVPQYRTDDLTHATDKETNKRTNERTDGRTDASLRPSFRPFVSYIYGLIIIAVKCRIVTKH